MRLPFDGLLPERNVLWQQFLARAVFAGGRMKHALRHAVTGLLTMAATLFAIPGSPASAATFPQYDHVFLIMMENQTLTSLIDNPAAPELTTWCAIGDPGRSG